MEGDGSAMERRGEEREQTCGKGMTIAGDGKRSALLAGIGGGYDWGFVGVVGTNGDYKLWELLNINIFYFNTNIILIYLFKYYEIIYFS